MSLRLKQNTAVTLMIGPFISDTDGKTPATGLSLVQADIRLSKNGGSFAQKNSATAPSHNENGWYTCALSTTDTNTLGLLVLAVTKTGALPLWVSLEVVSASEYDFAFGSGAVPANVTTWKGTAPNDLLSGRVDTSVGAMATNVISSTALSDAAVDKIIDEPVEGSYTLRQSMRIFNALSAGKTSGVGTSTINIRDLADTKNRISATMSSGNRTAVTLDVS